MSYQRLLDAASTMFQASSTRRGFLQRAALVGTAVATNPATYLMRPVSAYAAICSCSGSSCSCGSQCCDGYTEFCCTITGENTCPPGTLTAGWWKVDGSSFCGGAARYYLDCNAGCGSCGCGGSGVCGGSCSGTACGCANGSCDNRKSGCTLFRYGQCNQAVPCVGPIVCRIVTCTAPWQIDASCTTSPRTDENTRYHDAPCLHTDPNRPFGNIDAVTASAGRINVQGWTIDPDTTSALEVHVYVDGAFAGWGYANLARPDVGAAYPGYGDNHGFDISVPAGEGTHEVCIYAINVGGPNNTLLGCRQATVGGRPIGNIDSVTAVAHRVDITGWALDPDTTGPVEVHIYVDGRFATYGWADRSRPDVGQTFPGYGDDHGFSLSVDVAAGSHDVCVYAINVGGTQNPQLGCRRVSVGGPPVGNLDAATASGGRVVVDGWALDPDTTAPIEVHVYVDGRFATYGTASSPRPDVAAVYPGYGSAHGFNLSVPVSSGSHDVCVYAINVGGTINPLLGCRRVSSP